MKKEEYPIPHYRVQHSKPVGDVENIIGESPVVNGQALTGAELFRRMSSGLPVGCAVRSFNQVNPYLEKFSVFDSIRDYQIRHGMVDSSELEQTPAVVETQENPAPAEEAK